MKRMLMAGLLVLAVGCKGPKGDQGPQGVAGPGGAGKVDVIAGVVSSNFFRVTDSRIKTTSNVTVLIGIGGSFVELPVFIPVDGVNSLAVVFNGYVEIYNAQLANASSYQIVILTPTPAALPSGQFGDRLLW